jgi:hypothetical protein
MIYGRLRPSYGHRNVGPGWSLFSKFYYCSNASSDTLEDFSKQKFKSIKSETDEQCRLRFIKMKEDEEKENM